MAELHSADLDLLIPTTQGERREPEVLVSLREWIRPARAIVRDLEAAQAKGGLKDTALEGFVEELGLERFELEIVMYLEWLAKWERGEVGQKGKGWRMVFARSFLFPPFFFL